MGRLGWGVPRSSVRQATERYAFQTQLTLHPKCDHYSIPELYPNCDDWLNCTAHCTALEDGAAEGEEGDAPPTPQEAELISMGIERGVAMVALAKYDNKVEPAANYVFDQVSE